MYPSTRRVSALYTYVLWSVPHVVCVFCTLSTVCTVYTPYSLWSVASTVYTLMHSVLFLTDPPLAEACLSRFVLGPLPSTSL